MDRVAVPVIAGRTRAQDDSDQQRLVEEARKPFSSQLEESDWVMVNKGDIALAQHIYDSCPIMQTATVLYTDAMKQGGLSVQVGNGSVKTFKTNDLFGKTLLNWLADGNTMWDIFGFFMALAAPPNPSVADLYSGIEDTFSDVREQLFLIPHHKVDVYHKINLLGEHQWLVCEPPDNKLSMVSGLLSAVGGAATTPAMGRPIPNCFVFYKTPPDAQGRIRSKVMTLKEDFLWLQTMRRTALDAAKRRANPVLVTEHHDKKEDVMLHGTIPFENEFARQPQNVPDLSLRDRFINKLVRYRNAFSDADQAQINSCSAVLSSMVSEFENEVLGAARVDLPPEKKLARPVNAESPGIELVKLQIHFEQQVLQVFGIPPGMIQPESTHGKMVTNENAMTTYNLSLAARKHEVLVPVQIMLRKLYQGQLMAKYAFKYKPSLRDLVLNTRIVVTMPGIPPLEKLDQYYLAGLLKHDAYVAYLSSVHGIPKEHFETTPKISQLDLLTNGKKSLEELKVANASGGGEGSSKKKKKKKRKAES